MYNVEQKQVYTLHYELTYTFVGVWFEEQVCGSFNSFEDQNGAVVATANQHVVRSHVQR